MPERYRQLDVKAPLPYIRDEEKKKYKPKEVKFSYDYEQDMKETMKETIGTSTSTIIKEYTTIRSKKVTLWVYTHSHEEDAEHFFEAFEQLQKALHKVWKEASRNKTQDATILFDAFNAMTDGVAASSWQTILGQEKSRTWETFKEKVSLFICGKVLEEDAYDSQKTYLDNRPKPRKLSAQQWNDRIELLSLRLPYMFPTVNSFKLEYPASDFGGWWKEGGLTEAEHRRIILSKAPQMWQDKLDISDVKHEYKTMPAGELVKWYSKIESKELSEQARKPKERKGSNKDRDQSPRRTAYRRDRYSDREPEGSRYRYDNNRNRGRNRNEERRNRDNRYDRSRQYERPRDERQRYEKQRHGGQHDGNQRADRPIRRDDAYFEEDNRSDHHTKSTQESEAHFIDTWNDHFSKQDSIEGSNGSQHSEYYYSSYSSSEDYSTNS